MNFSGFKELKKLFHNLKRQEKKDFYYISIFIFFVSVIELGTTVMIMPFISVLLDQNQSGGPARYIVELFDGDNKLLIISSIFIGFIILSAFLKYLMHDLIYRNSFKWGRNLGVKMFRNMLGRNILFHKKMNSNDLTNTIFSKASFVSNNTFTPFLYILSSVCLIFIFLTLMFFIAPQAFLIFGISLGGFFLAFNFFTKLRIEKISKSISEDSNVSMRIVKDSLSSIKEILINGRIEKIVKDFFNSEKKYRRSLADLNIISATPRFVLESFGLILIILIALNFSDVGQNSAETISTLAFFAFALQRALPSFQLLFASFAKLNSSIDSINDTLDLLLENIPDKNNAEYPFKNEIKLSHISFKYKDKSESVIENVNYHFKKGGTYLIKGKTGVGKSTLFDILLGLMPPTSGFVYIDNKKLDYTDLGKWKNKISHLSQNFYLFDESIKANVILDQDYCEEKFLKSIKLSCLQDDMAAMPEKEMTIIGENGLRLSGGQRQRLALARCLYSDSDIYFFDEITSSLDKVTELKIIKNLTSLNDKTLFFISHNTSPFKNIAETIVLKDKHLLKE